MVITAGAAAAAPERHLRPWRPVVRAVAVLTVVALIVGVGWYAAAYQPLRSQGGGYWAGRVVVDGDRMRMRLGQGARSIDNVHGSELLVGPVRGGHVGLVIDLHNVGRLPVTVTGIERALPTGGFGRTRLFASTDPKDPQRSLTEVGEVTIPAGARQTIGVTVWVRDCPLSAAGGKTWIDRLDLRYRFAGVSRTATVALDHFAMSIAQPPLCPIPSR